MLGTYRESVYAMLLVLAAGFALITHMLGVLFDPGPAIVVSSAVVGIGVLLLPRGRQALGGLIGLLSVGLAGVVVPRLVTEFTTATDEMALTLVLSGLVLLLTFAVLRVTVFTDSMRAEGPLSAE